MQIENKAMTSQIKTHDKPLELKQGEIYKATIKERNANNEAILQIRSREIQVKFEGNPPSQDRVTVLISGQSSEQFVQVKVISEPPKTTTATSSTEAANINQALRSLGIANPSKELRQAAQMILNKGIPLNRESAQELRTFLEKEKGTVEQRLNTVQAIANKHLEVSTTHLRSVHEALHGRPLNEVLTSIVKEIDPKFQLHREHSAIEKIETRPQVEQRLAESRVLENRPQVELRSTEAKVLEGRPQVEQRSTEPRPSQDRPVSAEVRQVREQVQREPNIARAIDQVQREVVNNPRVEREVARQVERAVEEARALQQTGRESAARERMTQALQTAERDLGRVETRVQLEPRAVESRPQVEQRPSEPRVVESRPQVEQRSTEPRPAQDRPVSAEVLQVREQVQREPNIARAIEQVRNEVLNNPKISAEVSRQLERDVEGARTMNENGQTAAAKAQLLQSLLKVEQLLNLSAKNASVNQESPTLIKPTESLTKMQQTIQKEGNFQKATEQIRQLAQSTSFENSTIEKLEKTLKEAEHLKISGKEMAARQTIAQTLNEIDQQVKVEQQSMQTENKQYEINELFQSQQISSKDFIVQTVTEKLAQVQSEFKQLQREITRNLDNAHRLLDTFKNQSQPQVKPLLESTIKKLDNAILKSELMLFTDMKTEKDLLKASSQLAEAKKLLNKGNYQEASKIVQEVKNLVEKLIFKPSETKIKHFVMNEQQSQERSTPSKQLLQQFDEMSRQSALREGSARQTFEMVRGLGLNRDSELAQIFAGTRNSSEQEANQNLKSTLMKLMQSEDESISQQTRQALANITGQQLLSKSDTNNNLQSIFFNLPFLLQDKVENLQVFVNSKNEGQQIDWENCNLYFLIETRKLGDVGIFVHSIDRNLSLTIKNDQPFFKERMEPLAELCKENLKEVGYNIAALNFTKMTSSVHQQKDRHQNSEDRKEKLMPIFTEKGYDFKI